MTRFTIPDVRFPDAVSDHALDITVSPSEVVHPSSSVTVTCTADYSLLGGRDVIWRMRKGSVVVRVGYHGTLDHNFNVDGRRYSLSRVSSGLKDVHTLKIQDVKYEDSSTIECVFSAGKSRMSSIVIGVCDDAESASCKCMMEQEGWASPQCFKEPDDWVAKNNGYKDAVVVLAVFLGIAIAIGILMGVLAGRDCMAHALAKQKKMAERRSTAGRTNSLMIGQKSRYEDSQHLTQDGNDTISEINVDSQQQPYREERPRQKGRRSEREQRGPYPRHLVEDEQSDSGMSSANASTQGLALHTVHIHQDSNSSTSSQQAVRPKHPQKNIYAAHEDLSSGYATPYQPPPPVSPRSVQSEGDIAYSPGAENPRPPPRAAHTDVARGKSRGVESRAYFTNPKRLEFQQNGTNGHVQRDEGGPYVDQNSTVI
ncbi:hypothetical protein CAPTEDRAFT_215061 [Capitella teleta]|uniref:Ig-like domain-containing protein n=1 Tax=Capitella teleta TaxID=283909 RepID=R7UQ57_CAPTE|nr:hypothetical protein CAPTEDRAFT_215061 [Capitella teleta]|eukprot:ELU08654.1 hypothetical protein CAPTEDRAFT_215061 [Capitella teleta]